jgi:dienelactone hydrolase
MQYLAFLSLTPLLLAGCQGTPELSPCADFDCSGHGRCVALPGEKGPRPSCECDKGYLPSASGWLCLPATDSSLCAGVTCSGHGTCASVQGTPRCGCEAGFATGPDGLTCVNPCEGVSCSGHGLCALDGAGKARCGCDPGYLPSSDGTACEPSPVATGSTVTWVLTLMDDPTHHLGRMSLDVSEQSSGRLVETQSINYWVLGRRARQVFTFDSSGIELMSMSFDTEEQEGKVRRRRAGVATFAKESVGLTYQRGGKEATVTLAASSPLPMLGGYDHPGWTIGCFSPVFYSLLLERYDAVKGGVQTIQALVPEAGLLTPIKVQATAASTVQKPALSLPDHGIEVVYQNNLPEAIKLVNEGVVWSRFSSTPADLNLEDRPAATPFAPAALPTGFTESTVAIASADGTALEGTLAKPQSATPVLLPAVLFVSDTRGADRDVPYLQLPGAPFARHLAAHLAAAGFASLRYDPRGRGKSAGSASTLTLTQLRADATAALGKLAGTTGIDPARIFLASLGPGSLVAIPLLAGTPAPRGYLALSPVVKEVDKAVLYSVTAHMKAAGLPNNYQNQQKKPVEDALKAIAAGTFTGTEWNGLLVTTWKEMLAFDGSATLGATPKPVLALFGAEDLEVPPEGLQAAKDAAAKTGKLNLTTQSLPGTSYLLSEGTKTNIWESALLPFEIAPGAKTAILDWLKKN